jgi:hypothetical protein
VFKKSDEQLTNADELPGPVSAWTSFTRVSRSGGRTASAAAAAEVYLRSATGSTAEEIEQVRTTRGVKIDQLAELYHGGEVPELGDPDDAYIEPEPHGSDDAYIESEPTRAVGSVADELAKLAALRDSGVLTEDEFEAQKAKLLAG